MKTVLDKETGKVLFNTVIEEYTGENQIVISEILTEPMENPYFNFEKNEFYNKQ